MLASLGGNGTAIDRSRAQVIALTTGKDRMPVEGDHGPVADHARRDLRRVPRPNDGKAQGQPHPGRLTRRTDPLPKPCADSDVLMKIKPSADDLVAQHWRNFGWLLILMEKGWIDAQESSLASVL